MKRIHWWTLLGVSGAGLTALLLGQAVFGQPDVKLPLPTAPIEILLPNAPETKGSGAKVAPEGTTGQLPVFPGLPASPMPPKSPQPMLLIPPPVSPPPLLITPPVTKPVAPLPLPIKSEPTITMPTSSKVSLDVAPGRQQPALLVEWAGPTSIRINQPISCQIVVRNTSTTAAQNVVIRHRPSPGVTCKQSEPAASHDSGELVWNLGTLAPDQLRRIDLTLLAQARGSLNCHAVVTFSAVAGHQIQVREPQLAVKVSAPEKVIAGENVTLVFAISNPGDGTAEAVKLKTTLPEGFDHPRGKFVDFEVGNLQPKESKLLQLVCQARGAGTRQCTIAVVGDGGLSASDTTQVDILTPKLDIQVNGPKLRYLDRHAVYVLKVANPGTATASDVAVHKQIPAGFKFHQANHGGQYQEATRLVSWNIGELQPGQSKDIAVDLIPIEAGEHRLVARAQAARGLKSEADLRTVVEGLPSLYMEVSHIDDPIEVGAETAYEIRVANTGTKMESNVEVICTLPEQLEFKGAKCSTTLRYRQEGRDLIFEPLAKLAPKADVIYRVQVRGIAPGDIRFRTRIKSDGLKEPVLREESTRIYSDDAPLRPTASPAPMPIAPAPLKSVPGPMPILPTPTPIPSGPMPVPVPSTSKSVPAPLPGPSIPAPTAIPNGPVPLTLPSAPLPLPLPLPLPTPALPILPISR